MFFGRFRFGLSRVGLWIVVASSLVLLLMVVQTPQGLYSDPAWQLKSLQQYLLEGAPSPNHLVQPRPEDLSRDQIDWITWWPPGTQILALPFMSAGFSLGGTIRLIASICLMAGAIGWYRWFRMFDLPPWLLITFAVGLPWMRYASNALFLYSAEIFVYAITPWLLFMLYHLGEKSGARGLTTWWYARCMLIGVVLGATYLFKYSLLFVAMGGVVYLGIKFVRWGRPQWHGEPVREAVAHRYRLGRSMLRAADVRGLFAVGVLFLVPIVGLSWLNAELGAGMNSAAQTIGVHWSFEHVVHLLASPGLAAADADAPLRYLLLHPEHGIVSDTRWLAAAGLPAGVMLLWLVFRPRSSGGPGLLAQTVLVVSMGGMLAVWMFSGAASYEARHVAGASIAALPLALREGQRVWRVCGRWGQKVLGTIVLAYVAVPLLYGMVTVPAKVARTPGAYRVGPSRIYNPLLAALDVERVRDAVLRSFDPTTDVWYLTEPMSALDLPGRAIIRHADFVSPAVLARDEFYTSRTLKVHALLPAHFDAKAEIIRGSFPQARSWHRVEIAGSDYTLWTAALNVNVPPRQ